MVLVGDLLIAFSGTTQEDGLFEQVTADFFALGQTGLTADFFTLGQAGFIALLVALFLCLAHMPFFVVFVNAHLDRLRSVLFQKLCQHTAADAVIYCFFYGLRKRHILCVFPHQSGIFRIVLKGLARCV